MTKAFSQYLNIRQANAPSFSPDGQRVSFLTNITGVPQAWVVDVDGGWPDQLTFDAERVSGAVFSPSNNHLVFSRDVGGNENAQIFLVNSDGSDERKLTNADDKIHSLSERLKMIKELIDIHCSTEEETCPDVEESEKAIVEAIEKLYVEELQTREPEGDA